MSGLQQVPESPCKGCEERTVEPNCHTNCIAYKMWYDRYRARKTSLEADRNALYEQERDLHWNNFRKSGG